MTPSMSFALGTLESPPVLGNPFANVQAPDKPAVHVAMPEKKIDASIKPVNNTKGSDSQDKPELSPKNFKYIYSNTVKTQGKYSDYLKDMDKVIPILDNIKSVITSDEMSKVQLFCAKVNVLDLYVNYMQSKYSGRTESKYSSYKNLLALNKNLVETAAYIRNADKYRKVARGSLKARQADEKYVSTRLNSSLVYIDQTLFILKESK